MSITVLIVDDRPEGRVSLRKVVTETPGFEQIGEAASGEEALEAGLALEPDLALIDETMPGLGGEELAFRLRAALPTLKVELVREGESLSPAQLQAVWRGRSL